MNTVLIQINNNKAYKLLEDLEDLHLIKLLGKTDAKVQKKLSEKYAGMLPSNVAEELQKYVTESRKQWSK
jgi:hypothetical protein